MAELSIGGGSLSVARRGTSAWTRAATVVRDTYHDRYGADVDPSPDRFALLERQPGCTPLAGAVAGLTFAGDGTLLSEHYLGGAVQDVIGERLGLRLDRHDVIEVGALASTVPGAGVQLVALLPLLCWCNSARVALCTVTERVAGLLAAASVPYTPLGAAREDALPAGQRGRWGTYYATRPCVGFVDATYIGPILAERGVDTGGLRRAG